MDSVSRCGVSLPSTLLATDDLTPDGGGLLVRVLITGGAGYIGSVAVERALAAGHEVGVLDNLWRGHRGAIPDDVAFLQVDLRDANATRDAVASSDRARSELGWNPTHSTLDQMVGSAWDWINVHPNGYED